MAAQIKIVGTEQFERLARDLKQAGDGRLTREMGREMKRAAQPVVQDMQNTVRGLTTLGGGRGGGASARAARAAHSLRRRKNPSEIAKQRAHQGSGLRATVARTVKPTVRTGGAKASVTIRSSRSMMPADQQKLPAYMNRGQWRHPVFGNRKNWAAQAVTPGWFDKPARRGAPKVRQEAVNVVIRTINKLGS